MQVHYKYYNYESGEEVDFNCPEEEPLASGFCIFHDKDYLQDKTNYEEHERKVLDRLKNKVNHAIYNNEPLFCIGFQLPDFSLSDLRNISKEFTKSVYIFLWITALCGKTSEITSSYIVICIFIIIIYNV
jgi:hypothetical protein